MKERYLLITYYHDINVRYFQYFKEVVEALGYLKKDYLNDRDFRYEIFYIKPIHYDWR